MEKIDNEIWRKKAEDLWDYLKSTPTSIPPELRCLVNECREVAESIQGDDDFPTWRKRCKTMKIPYQIKRHGFCRWFPKTRNQYDLYKRANARKGNKHAETSTIKLIDAKSFLPTLETNADQINTILNHPQKLKGLISLLGDEEEDD